MELVYEDGVVVGQRYLNGSVLFHLKEFICHFDKSVVCCRSGWCVRKSKNFHSNGSRSKILDICLRYQSDERQTHL